MISRDRSQASELIKADTSDCSLFSSAKFPIEYLQKEKVSDKRAVEFCVIYLSYPISQAPDYQYPMETMIKVLQQYQGLHQSPASAFSPLTPFVLSPEDTKNSSSAFSKVRKIKNLI